MGHTELQSAGFRKLDVEVSKLLSLSQWAFKEIYEKQASTPL